MEESEHLWVAVEQVQEGVGQLSLLESVTTPAVVGVGYH